MKMLIMVLLLLAMAYVGYHYISQARLEKPRYTVLKKQGAYELRAYEPMLVAEVTVEGTRHEAARRGFRLLAAFIFGDHEPQAAEAAEGSIAMTAPVMQHRIAMTAPVMEEAPSLDSTSWVIRFMMPHQYTEATLPKPRNPAVRIHRVPAHTKAVLRFTGSITHASLQQHEARLDQRMRDAQLQPYGDVQYAFYNPPWTLPWLRRNEVMRDVRVPD